MSKILHDLIDSAQMVLNRYANQLRQGQILKKKDGGLQFEEFLFMGLHNGYGLES